MVQKNFKAELGGQERTFWVGMGFLSLFLKAANKPLAEVEEYITTNPYEAIPKMINNSLLYGYKRVGAEAEFNEFIVSEWIDEAGGFGSDFVKLFMNKFMDAMQSNLPKQPESTGKQKKSTVKPLKANT